ncbi:MAG: right-handed parallel beta-helix repeat-containing protein [Flavobacteriales bacterium]|nr:right-handed parallel beta-helix repeat-containing protein [Flavobacteriales bacterium]
MKYFSTIFLFFYLVKFLFSQDIQKQLQSQFILAKPGDTIHIPSGKFELTKSLLLDGKKNLVIKGAGMNQSILSFKGQYEGAEGIKINQCQNITLMDFSVTDAKGDCIKALNTEKISFIRITVAWTGKISPKNGAYGLYPVSCSNVLIHECVAIGASDAGIYVGQSDQVVVSGCEAKYNVAGIEIENTTNAEVFNNYAHDNTGGILVFDLPELPKKQGGNVRVYNNRVIHNNTKNFAPKGNIVGQVPSGTGMFVLATPRVEIFDNLIEENKTVSIGICSFYISERKFNDSLYDPIPYQISIHNNRFLRKKANPPMNNKIGLLLKFKLGKKIPHIVYDGITRDEMLNGSGKLKDEFKICIQNNENESFVDLDADKNFKNITFDLAPYRCTMNVTKP